MRIAHFIRQVFTIAIGFLVSLFCLCLIAVFVFSQLISTDHKQYEVQENSVLELDMEGRVVECVPGSLFGSNKGVIDLKVVKRAIHQATEDSRMRAIYLNLSYFRVGWAALEEIRAALLAFKKQGKTIVAYGDFYTQKSYYLASVADEVILNPSGCLEFQGLSATVDFYTKLFENIAIKPVIFRVGACKDAVEPFCLNKMSEESRKQTGAYLSSLYEHFLTNISLSRDIAVTALKQCAHNLSAILPNDVLHATLITRIGYETEAKKLLKEKLGDAPSFVSYKRYRPSKDQTGLIHKVAVLVAEGEIINGSIASGYVGARDFVSLLKAIQEDASIKAVVLRINSPGGDGLASDNIWKAIEELKIVKPVVASMSNMAASGGYYIAAPCHYIFAQPTTITGSIGIFALLFDPTELMHKVGIERDVVKTAPSADFLNPRTSCSQVEAKLMYKILQTSYNAFIQKVSDGRGLTLAQVEKLAGGRIYAGTVAQKNGLVDELGGLEAAIAKAASLASLTEKYHVCYFPRPKTKWECLLSYTSSSAKMELLSSLAQQYPILNHCPIMHRRRGVQAMLPYTIDID